MNRYKCSACGGNQYSSDSRKEKEPCIYCGHKGTKLMENINEDQENSYQERKKNEK